MVEISASDQAARQTYVDRLVDLVATKSVEPGDASIEDVLNAIEAEPLPPVTDPMVLRTIRWGVIGAVLTMNDVSATASGMLHAEIQKAIRAKRPKEEQSVNEQAATALAKVILAMAGGRGYRCRSPKNVPQNSGHA